MENNFNLSPNYDINYLTLFYFLTVTQHYFLSFTVPWVDHMVIQLLLAAEIGVDDTADTGCSVGEPHHDGRPPGLVEPLHQPRDLSCLP